MVAHWLTNQITVFETAGNTYGIQA
jgi:hypothetical protein